MFASACALTTHQEPQLSELRVSRKQCSRMCFFVSFGFTKDLGTSWFYHVLPRKLKVVDCPVVFFFKKQQLKHLNSIGDVIPRRPP